jgi:hypothetical protein
MVKIIKAAKKVAPVAAPVAKAIKEKIDESREKKEERHLKLLEELNDKLEKQTSFWGNIKIGLVRGAATAIGATVIAAIALSILANVVDTVDDVPLIRDIIQESNVNNALNKQE